VSGYPSGISIGAAWNKELALQKADHMGAEFKAKGANVVLGPVAGPLGRVARGGRNWEGFSNDPYLAGSLTRQAISGIQKHAIACAKHFVANEQETHRNPPLLFTSGSLEQAVSSNIDDKTMHELYAWPFQDAVHAGAGAVMCSYNQLNGSYGCQNSKALNGLLKEEFGFQGFVVSDWFAQHSGVSSANAGMDMAMPGSAFWQNGNLSLMVSNGSISQSRLDDMATRIVATWYRYAHFQPGTGMPASLNSPHELVDARDPASESVILQSAIEGHVLVKNEAHALPLRKPKVLSIFGYDAVVAERNSPTGGFFNKWDFTMENTQTIPGSGDFSDSQLALTFLSNEPWDTPVPGVVSLRICS
jgi:beta-glucosidase